jgi:periplasmic divalent cation tolerance protein
MSDGVGENPNALALAIITAPEDEAQEIAQGLVDEGLAACVQVLSGAQSHYVWQGRVEVDRESLLFLKTQNQNRDRIIAYLKAHHSYEVPEFLLFAVDDGHPDYLQWMRETLS